MTFIEEARRLLRFAERRVSVIGPLRSATINNTLTISRLPVCFQTTAMQRDLGRQGV